MDCTLAIDCVRPDSPDEKRKGIVKTTKGGVVGGWEATKLVAGVTSNYEHI
jgi:hypothetical protein